MKNFTTRQRMTTVVIDVIEPAPMTTVELAPIDDAPIAVSRTVSADVRSRKSYCAHARGEFDDVITQVIPVETIEQVRTRKVA